MARFFSRLPARLQRRGAIAFIVLALAVAGGLFGLVMLHDAPEDVSYSVFSQQLAAGQVAKVTVGEGGLTVVRATGDRQFVRLPSGLLDAAYLDKLAASGVDVQVGRQEGEFAGVVGAVAPLLLLALIGLTLAFQFDVRGRLAWPPVAKAVPTRFRDVAGQEETKAELAEIVTFLKEPESFARVGARPPRGVLMVGPPGTGKTLIARALAGEAGVAFMAVAGSEFSAAFVGVSKNRVARLFKEARKRAPCILFIDEIDSLGKKRGAGGSAADREYDTTLNQLLVEMDGFQGSDGVIVVGATNRTDVLDPALLRPGRFDRHVHVGLPDVGGREAILRVHAARVKLGPDVDLRTVAKGTPGFSGAELANLVNEAAVHAARVGADAATMEHFEQARTKLLIGLERRSLVLDDDERRLVAVHEAGHALCATLLAAADRVHSATIVPHGGALGMVMRLPEKDRLCVPLDKLRADLVVAMGGRAAEEAVFGKDKVTTGAAADISFASDLAVRMVSEWGMSPRLGMIKIEKGDRDLPLEAQDEVRNIVDDAYRAARAMMDERRVALDRLAEELLRRETLNGDEVRQLVAESAAPADASLRAA
ncbi:AAA family ATPase [Alsobacter sp. SYSU M60028]|uniref:ATP-dependent zinc metalloprotease FtsH n=1 Tax=Alsobacter ponti TaxID=2962936 RepID=A0ABT1LI70_9HYPH|nr:FtsH/Yme1/Tma family ATP-dependent metallopeptidase [Alsobacter ponti]MCP8941149.1 AAA family ATPase [Alsobacter ponti]